MNMPAKALQATLAFRSTVAKQLFHLLERQDISYCVVGDTETFPDEIGSDLDIVVHQKNLGRISSLLATFCNTHRLQLVQMLQHEQTAQYFAIAGFDDHGRLHFVHPDFSGDYYRMGKPFLSSEELLCDRVPALDAGSQPKGFYVAAPAKEFIYYLLKKIDKQQLTDRHGAHLSKHWHRDPAGARMQLQRYWQGAHLELLEQAAVSDNWNSVRDVLPALQRALHDRIRFTPTATLGEYRRLLRRALHPTGFAIAFLGPDGSGKSSVIENVRLDLAPAFRRTAYFHLRPQVGQGTGARVVIDATDPHGQAPRGMLSSMGKVLFYLFDYTAGHLLKVRPKLIRSTLVIFDRYYHDLLVDPRRYRYGGPRWFSRLAGRLVPRPDVFVFLDAPPEVLQARKQEVPFEETGRQRAAYLELARTLRNSHVIDASRPLHVVIEQVERLILTLLEHRTASRLSPQPMTDD
jgi:thymidylate kinase